MSISLRSLARLRRPSLVSWTLARFKYEQSKKENEARKHQVKTRLREVRMKPKIDVHDIDFKTRTVEKLLRQGDKVKVTVMFRGREITHPQIGKNLLDRIFGNLENVATKEKDAALEGRHMSMILTADKRGIAARDRAAELEAEAQNGPAKPEEEAESGKRRTGDRGRVRGLTSAKDQDAQGRRLTLSRNGRREDHANVRKPQQLPPEEAQARPGEVRPNRSRFRVAVADHREDARKVTRSPGG